MGILGAGAIGTYVGGLLASEGREVVLIGRERVRRELEGGLRLTDLDGRATRVSVRIETDPAALADCGVVLVAVKSGATVEAAQTAASFCARDALLISLQNGLRNAEMLRANGPLRALAGIVGFNVVSNGATYRRTTTGPLVIEATKDPRVEDAARAWRSAGLEVALRHDVRALQWSKLIMNLSNAVSALSGEPTPVLLFDPAYRRILRATLAEALGVLRAAKVKTRRFGPLPVQLFPWVLGLPTPALRVVLAAQLRVDPEARSSMWDDLQRGRKTEVEELNGEIVRLALATGMDAPLNRRLVELVHRAEARGPGSPNLRAAELGALLSL